MAPRPRLQLVRPYRDVETFVEAEGWTIRKRSMLLVGAPDVAIGTEVRCDISIETGETLIRAEGRIVEQIAAQGDRPGGLKLRFQRIAPDTQKLIGRILASATQPIDSGPTASPEPLAMPETQTDESGTARSRPTEPAPPEGEDPDSGLHARVVAPVAAPPNREQLLDRLRARQRRRIEDDSGPAKPSDADEDTG